MIFIRHVSVLIEIYMKQKTAARRAPRAPVRSRAPARTPAAAAQLFELTGFRRVTVLEICACIIKLRR